MVREKTKKTKIIRDKLKDEIIREIWTPSETEEEKEERKKKHNERIIKGRIIRYIRTLFEQEEDYYEPERIKVIFRTIIALNIKVMVIKTETYH